MERKDRIDAFAAVSLVMFSGLLGLNQVMVKLVNAGLAPVFQAGLRSVFAFLPVLLFAWFARRKLSITDGSLWPGIVCGVLFAAEFMMLFMALEYTTVARVSVFFYTMPFWVALAAHFLIPGERLNSVRIMGLLLALAGVVLALLYNADPASENALLGDLLCLGGAICWAAIAIIARTTHLQKSSPEMQLLYQLFVSALIMVPIALWTGETVREFETWHGYVFAVQVLGVVAFGFSFWFWLLSKYPASDMASFSFLAPLFGVFFGWLILDEVIYPTLVLALAMVAIGIVLVNKKPRPVPPVA